MFARRTVSYNSATTCYNYCNLIQNNETTRDIYTRFNVLYGRVTCVTVWTSYYLTNPLCATHAALGTKPRNVAVKTSSCRNIEVVKYYTLLCLIVFFVELHYIHLNMCVI